MDQLCVRPMSSATVTGPDACQTRCCSWRALPDAAPLVTAVDGGQRNPEFPLTREPFPRWLLLSMFPTHTPNNTRLGVSIPGRLRDPRFRWLAGGIALVISVLVPMLVAMHVRQVGRLDWFLAILAYLILWTVTAELFYMSAARL